jgi:replicative DNA helicase
MDISGVVGTSKMERKIENRQQEISTLTRMLKHLARDMDCPVLVLSQLSREVERRGSKGGNRPVLADLRESGAIEQDADLVMFIYQETAREDDDFDADTIRKISLAKHRNGETGDIELRWIGQNMKFANYDPGADRLSPY